MRLLGGLRRSTEGEFVDTDFVLNRKFMIMHN